ncbi:hypothetical protein BDV11DRAFT_184145 [Aspergillus similis]
MLYARGTRNARAPFAYCWSTGLGACSLTLGDWHDYWRRSADLQTLSGLGKWLTLSSPQRASCCCQLKHRSTGLKEKKTREEEKA